jgi:DNA primase
MTTRLSPIQAARRRHPLAQVAVRTGIWLPTTTGTVTVRCPMPAHGHPDRTPSLRLYLDDDTWYCFACSTHGGDVIDWVEQTEAVGWRQAIDILDSGSRVTNAWSFATASAGGHQTVPLSVGPVERPNLSRTSRTRVQEAVDCAWQHCTSGPLHAHAVAYLAGRRIDVTALEAHTGRVEVGHTPSHGPSLLSRLRADGFTTDELVDAGLAHRYADGRLTDFYRQRVLIPIRGDEGGIAGLVGRNVGDPFWGKYKNPPRTVVYDKSINLYQPLPPPTSPRGTMIVVEGTLDALAVAAAAVKVGAARHFCPLTQSGRELSTFQVAAVLRMHRCPVVVAMDGDTAGQDSNRRVAAALAAAGEGSC